MALTKRRQKGNDAESDASAYLQKSGLKVVDKNYNCKLGEIDLIMKDKDGTLIFVEVRYRNNQRFGGAMQSVNIHKQKKLIRAAEIYLQQLKFIPACRFDVVAIDGNQIQWLKNAIDGF